MTFSNSVRQIDFRKSLYRNNENLFKLLHSVLHPFFRSSTSCISCAVACRLQGTRT